MRLFSVEPYANQSVCVAISGGADSVCLLHYLYINAEIFHIRLTALTCEHGIRGEHSLADLRFVQDFCESLNVPLDVYRIDVPSYAKEHHMGTEEAARALRYQCYHETARKRNAVIATAHHKEDEAETILFRLIRGTSLSGLNAFPGQEEIIRPLLATSKAEILQYLKENNLSYVTDESNFDERYSRNFLRHEVFAPLAEKFPYATDNLISFARRATGDDEYLQSLAKSLLILQNGEARVPCDLPDSLFSRAVLAAMKELGAEKDYTSKNIEEVCALRSLQTGKTACLPFGLCAAKEYGEIVISRPADPLFEQYPFAFGSFAFRDFEAIVTTEKRPSLTADFDRFPKDCVIRTRREGDVITPFGGNSKTLKKFLTDKKIPARVSRFLPVAACENEIYAVFGVEISEKVKIVPQTQTICYLDLSSTLKK